MGSVQTLHSLIELVAAKLRPLGAARPGLLVDDDLGDVAVDRRLLAADQAREAEDEESTRDHDGSPSGD